MASHEFLEHTSETVLRVRAADLSGVVAEAGRAFAGLVRRGGPVPAATLPPREIVLFAPDDAALLVDWLNELLFLAEHERWLAVAFDAVEAGEGRVRATVRGARLAEPPAFVKAATMGGLRLQRTADGLEAEVTLDV
jgi:SHS2 domain-containing protein